MAKTTKKKRKKKKKVTSKSSDSSKSKNSDVSSGEETKKSMERALVIANNKSKFAGAAQFLTRRDVETVVVGSLPEAIKLVTEAKPQYVFMSFNLKNANVAKTSQLLTSTFGIKCVIFAESTDSRTASLLSRGGFKYTMNAPISGPGMYMQIQKIIRTEEQERKRKEQREKREFADQADMDQSDVIKCKGSDLKNLSKDGNWEKAGKDSKGRNRWTFDGPGQSHGDKDGEFAYFGDEPPKLNENGDWDIPEDGELGFRENTYIEPEIEEENSDSTESDDGDTPRFSLDSNESPDISQAEIEELIEDGNDDETPGFDTSNDDIAPSDGVHFQDKIESKNKKKLYMPSKDPSLQSDYDNENGAPSSTDLNFNDTEGSAEPTGFSENSNSNDNTSEQGFEESQSRTQDGGQSQESSSGAMKKEKTGFSQDSSGDQRATSSEDETDSENKGASFSEDETASKEMEASNEKRDPESFSEREEALESDAQSSSQEGLNSEEGKASQEGPDAQAYAEGEKGPAANEFNVNPQEGSAAKSGSEEASKKADSELKLNNEDSKEKAVATQKALDEVLDTEGSIENFVDDGVKNLRIFSLVTKQFQGLVVLAVAGTNHLEDILLQQIKNKLALYLKMTPEETKELDSFDMETEELDLKSWCLDESDFTVKTQHKTDEVVCSFVEIKEIVGQIKESPSPEMAAIELRSISAEIEVNFDAFLYFPVNKKYINYIKSGSRFTNQQLGKLVTSNFHYLHIKREDCREYMRYCIKVYVVTSMSNKPDLLKNAV